MIIPLARRHPPKGGSVQPGTLAGDRHPRRRSSCNRIARWGKPWGGCGHAVPDDAMPLRTWCPPRRPTRTARSAGPDGRALRATISRRSTRRALVGAVGPPAPPTGDVLRGVDAARVGEEPGDGGAVVEL